MPYDWRTGLASVGPPNPNTYGPRQPNTVGVRGAPPPNPFAFMPAPSAPKPTWLPTSLGGTGGIAPKAPAGATAAKPKAAVDPLTRLLNTLYGQIETPAQQEARVNREVSAQIKAQQDMIDKEYARERADALAQYQAQSMAGAAAAAMNKDLFGSVGGEFNAAAKEMKGLSHGLTGATAKQTGKDVGAANAELARTGSPLISGEGSMYAPGGSIQAGVEDYRGGTLAAQMFGTQGEAANFGLAGQISSQNLKAVDDANAALMVSMHDIRNNQAKAVDALAAGRADLAHTYLNDARDSQVKSISLIQGLLAQKQATAAAGTKTAMDLAKLKISAGHLDLSAKSLQARMANQSFNQNMSQIKEGRMKGTADFNKAATQTRLENAAIAAGVTQGAIDVNRSRAVGHVVDKLGRPMLDSKGGLIPASRLNKAAAAAKGMTANARAAAMTKAQARIPEWFYGTRSATGVAGGKLVSADQAQGFDPTDVSTWGKNRVSYGEAQKRLARMGVKRPQALSMLSEMWHRGQGGRPWLSTEERTAARKALGVHGLDKLILQANAMLKADPSEAGYAKAAASIQALLKKLGLPAAI